MRLVHALPVLALLSGCPTRDVSEIDIHPSKQQIKDIPVSTNRDVDILVLVDNSSSMQDKQANLASNFVAFANVLENIPGGLPNIHLGVTSSNVGVGGYDIGGCTGNGDHGELQNTPRVTGCTAPTSNSESPMGRFIEDIDQGNGTRLRNYPDGSLADTFACIAQLGVAGCGFEHHFEGVKLALDGSNAANAGFLRDNAYLAVLILADEDDCSAQDNQIFDPDMSTADDGLNGKYGPLQSYRCTQYSVECDGMDLGRTAETYNSCVPRSDSYFWGSDHYVDFLKSLKKDPNQIFVSIIGAPPTPFATVISNDPETPGWPMLAHSCTFTDASGMTAVGDPGVRFKALVDAFGAHGTYESICQADYTDSLTNIAKALAEVIGNPCIEGDIDTTDIDPNAMGLQLQCDVEDVVDPDTGDETQTVVPRCPMTGPNTPAVSPRPCWWAEIDTADCPAATYPSSVELHVEQDTTALPPGTHVVANCVSN